MAPTIQKALVATALTMSILVAARDTWLAFGKNWISFALGVAVLIAWTAATMSLAMLPRDK